MYIPKLWYPGHTVDHPDNEWASKVKGQLTSFEHPLASAAMALEWFEKARTIFESELLNHQSLSETSDTFPSNPGHDTDDLPWSYKRQIVFVHAQTFLYSLDRIDRTLQVLMTFLAKPYDMSDIYKYFRQSVPDLRGVRNSSAHIEDRIQGLGPNREPIVPNPFGFIILENLHGTKFMSTMANGNLGKVDVTVDTLKASETAIQAVIDLLKWKGSPCHWP
jgi:hypothetical protein